MVSGTALSCSRASWITAPANSGPRIGPDLDPTTTRTTRLSTSPSGPSDHLTDSWTDPGHGGPAVPLPLRAGLKRVSVRALMIVIPVVVVPTSVVPAAVIIIIVVVRVTAAVVVVVLVLPVVVSVLVVTVARAHEDVPDDRDVPAVVVGNDQGDREVPRGRVRVRRLVRHVHGEGRTRARVRIWAHAVVVVRVGRVRAVPEVPGEREVGAPRVMGRRSEGERRAARPAFF